MAKRDIKIILPYSDINQRAKGAAAYSVLNPDTNSLSASGRSKGALFVSATIEIKNIINSGRRGHIFITLSCLSIIFIKFGVSLLKNTTVNITNPITTSYDIICEVDLKDPKKEYLELEDQPLHKTVRIETEETANIYNIS